MTLEKFTHNWYVKVICFVIALILVFFTRGNSLKEELVVVFLKAKTNNNYTFTESIPSRVTLILKGEASEIKKIRRDALSAYIDASNIEKDGIFTIPVQIKQDKIYGQTDKVEITVNPISITTTIEEKITKYLKVESVITGLPAHGYKINSWTINPTALSIAGPKSHIQNLESIKTDPIDITGQSMNFTMRVKLNKADPLLSFPEGEFVDFKGVIHGINVTQTIDNVNIEVNGLADNLYIDGELPLITVNVSGKLLTLEELSKKGIILTIDLAEIITPGKYHVPISYIPSSKLNVSVEFEDFIDIIIIKKPIKSGEE